MTIEKNKIGQFKKINDFSDIENDKYVVKWLDGIKSKRDRLSVMQDFCNFLDKTPTELAQEHQNDLKLDVLERSNIAKKQLNAFFGYLTNTNNKKWKNTLNKKIISKPKGWNSARQYVFSRLLSFYSRLEIPVKYNKKEKPIELSTNIREKTWRTNINGERKIIEHDDKKEYLKQIRDSFNSLRDKAILLGKLSSALDDVDMFNLKIKDFKDGYLPNYNICYLQGNRQKDGVLYQTFFGNEACNMLNLYINDRLDKINKKGNEKITEIPKTEYLFVANKKRMIERYFTEKMKEIIDKLELGNITPKSLRRWFNTHLEKNSVKTSIIRRLMGHKGDIGDEHYNQIFEQAKEGERGELALFFIENIDALVSLGNGNRKITEVDKKVEDLENQVKELIDEKQELKERIKEIEVDNEKSGEKQKDVIDKLRERIYKLEDFYEKTNKVLPDLLEMYDFFDDIIKRTPTPIQKQISKKEIIETLGLKESSEKSGEKVEISPEVKKKSK